MSCLSSLRCSGSHLGSSSSLRLPLAIYKHVQPRPIPPAGYLILRLKIIQSYVIEDARSGDPSPRSFQRI